MRSDIRSARKMTRAISVNRQALTSDRQIVPQMADDLRVLCANAGGVVEDDLELLGWSRQQVTAFGRRARERANALSADADAR